MTNAVVLMNMIRSEQEVPGRQYRQQSGQFAYCITSGIRIEEREAYFAQAAQWGWTLVMSLKKEIG